MRKLRLAVLGSVVALLVAPVPTAVADEQRVVSAPNEDFSLTVQVFARTDKDGDANPDTATHSDLLRNVVNIFRQGDREQTVQSTVTVDRPGTEFDEQHTFTCSMTGNFVGCGFVPTLLGEKDTTNPNKAPDKVHKQWGTGPYTITVEATSDTGDTATASASVEIH
jgi:hypothetical protein